MKTLGQIACEAFNRGRPIDQAWSELMPIEKDWEAAAQAVRAAVIDECAKACELEKLVEQEREDAIFNSVIDHCIAKIHALKP